MAEKLSKRAAQRIANAVAAGIREAAAEPMPVKKVAKKKSVAQRRTERRTAQSKKKPQGAREKIGRALEATMVTEPGRRVARAVGGYKKKKSRFQGEVIPGAKPGEKATAGFGGAMPIPGRGGKVSRTHGTGLTRIEETMPLVGTRKKIEPVKKRKKKKRRKSGKVKI